MKTNSGEYFACSQGIQPQAVAGKLGLITFNYSVVDYLATPLYLETPLENPLLFL